jgi:hypothetical protein
MPRKTKAQKAAAKRVAEGCVVHSGTNGHFESNKKQCGPTAGLEAGGSTLEVVDERTVEEEWEAYEAAEVANVDRELEGEEEEENSEDQNSADAEILDAVTDDGISAIWSTIEEVERRWNPVGQNGGHGATSRSSVFKQEQDRRLLAEWGRQQ